MSICIILTLATITVSPIILIILYKPVIRKCRGALLMHLL